MKRPVLHLQELYGKLFWNEGGDWIGGEGSAQHIMLSMCEGWDPQRSRKLSLVFWNWGFICLIGWRCCVTLCGSRLLHEVGDWLGRRESLRDPLHEGQCA